MIDEDSKLIDFIGPETWFIFDALNLDKNWLYDSPGSWSCNESFKKGRKFVANIKVVNDAAERGVKLHSDYAAILTENEEQRASLLQVVEKHRKQYVDFKKSTLALLQIKCLQGTIVWRMKCYVTFFMLKFFFVF